MAAPAKTASPPPPPPPPPVAKKPVNPLAEGAKAGFDPLRPVRMAKGFIGGTFNNTLNGAASWGRRGMWVGLGLALLAVVAGAFPAIGLAGIFAAGVVGLVAGAALGGGIGLLTGGAMGVGRSMRAEKYASDLQAKQTGKAHQPGSDYRGAYASAQSDKAQGNYITDRTLQQEREIRQEESTYWRDTVDHERFHAMGGGREF
jgi:hypothetical protein